MSLLPVRCAKCGNLFLHHEQTIYIPYLMDWIHRGPCREPQLRQAVVKPDNLDYMRKNYARVAETPKADRQFKAGLTFDHLATLIEDGIKKQLLFGSSLFFFARNDDWQKPFPRQDYTRTWSVPKKHNGFTPDDVRFLLKIARTVDHYYYPPRVG